MSNESIAQVHCYTSVAQSKKKSCANLEQCIVFFFLQMLFYQL